jgi:hypothetical protein
VEGDEKCIVIPVEKPVETDQIGDPNLRVRLILKV